MKFPIARGISLNLNDTTFSAELSNPAAVTDSHGTSSSHTVSDEMPLMLCHGDNGDVMIQPILMSKVHK